MEMRDQFYSRGRYGYGGEEKNFVLPGIEPRLSRP
jgi:hypothetical protein